MGKESEKLVELQIERLRETIKEKWALLAIGQGKEDGPNNCALCKEWRKKGSSEDTEIYDLYYCSENCPVYEYTGRMFCEETPYDLYNEIGNETIVDYNQCRTQPVRLREAANQELMFLQMLLELKKDELRLLTE